MSRAPSSVSYSFGPGPWTPAVRALILANVAVFLLEFLLPLRTLFGLTPALVLTRGWIWQAFTYQFLHDESGVLHILFNMLMLWMFGVDLERRWGARAFTKYYLVCGTGAGLVTILVALLPFDVTRAIYVIPTIGASGAIYGLLLAWAVAFPRRQLLLFMLFPVEARYAVMIFGAIALFLGLNGGTGIAEFTHLGGLAVGWLYLKGGTGLRADVRSRILTWRMARLRKRFEVHDGKKSDRWNVH